MQVPQQLVQQRVGPHLVAHAVVEGEEQGEGQRAHQRVQAPQWPIRKVHVGGVERVLKMALPCARQLAGLHTGHLRGTERREERGLSAGEPKGIRDETSRDKMNVLRRKGLNILGESHVPINMVYYRASPAKLDIGRLGPPTSTTHLENLLHNLIRSEGTRLPY